MSIRTASILTAAAVAMTASPRFAAAQAPVQSQRRVEFRIPGGALVPSGSQRNVLKDGHITAAQLSVVIRPSLAVTGTFGWARSRDLTLADRPKLDVFTADLGLEARAGRWFAGAGAGTRSYNYRSLDVDATHNLAGYVAAGGSASIGRVGLRLEVRDYVTGFQPLTGAGAAAVRNDVVAMFALSFNRSR